MEIYPENRFWKTYFGKRISENGFRKTSFEKRVQKCAQVRRGEFYENGSKFTGISERRYRSDRGNYQRGMAL
ncbi:unknown [Lachnospiraceae bacterium CAG:215]|nr:unknown [Lachnospiraceae bacterium CAG:215]